MSMCLFLICVSYDVDINSAIKHQWRKSKMNEWMNDALSFHFNLHSNDDDDDDDDDGTFLVVVVLMYWFVDMKNCLNIFDMMMKGRKREREKKIHIFHNTCSFANNINILICYLWWLLAEKNETKCLDPVKKANPDVNKQTG